MDIDRDIKCKSEWFDRGRHEHILALITVLFVDLAQVWHADVPTCLPYPVNFSCNYPL